MGILISLIALPIQAIHKRREKKKAQRIAPNYSSQPAPVPSLYQSQAQAQRSPQESQEQASAARASEWQKQQQREQQGDEFNTTLGAAPVGFLSTA
jgi:hypothetical protein